MTEHTFCVMLQITTTDPRLSEAALITMIRSGKAADVAKMRRLIMKTLPQDVERVSAVLPLEHARMLLLLHEELGEQIAEYLRVTGIVPNANGNTARPPADYIPPTRD